MKARNIIDLTHTIHAGVPSWPSDKKGSFSVKTFLNYNKGGFFSQILSIPEHYGTHMDAPAHGLKGMHSIDQIDSSELICPAVVIDVQKKVKINSDYCLMVDDIKEWEKKNGKIKNGSVVLILTGWGKFWNSKKKYLNKDKQGTMHFPGFSEEAVKFLVEKRKINGIGIDTMSIDSGNSKDFSSHQVLFKHNKFALENLANLHKLPPIGSTIIIAPMKIKGGSGSPVRVFASINK